MQNENAMGEDFGGRRGRRDSRSTAAVMRPGVAGSQRAPRPGGRAAAQQVTTPHTGTGLAGPEGPEFPTQGNVALAPVVPQDAPKATTGRLGPWLKVAPPLPVSVPRAPFIMLVLLVVVGGVLGILVVNTKINENAFRLDRLQQEQAALNLQQQDLEQQIAYLESPNNLWAAAKKLGLVPAGTPAFIQLPDGTVIGVPQPAGGTPSVASNQPPTGRPPTGR